MCIYTDSHKRKRGEDKIFFLKDKVLRYKIKAPGYIIKKLLRAAPKTLTHFDYTAMGLFSALKYLQSVFRQKQYGKWKNSLKYSGRQ